MRCNRKPVLPFPARSGLGVAIGVLAAACSGIPPAPGKAAELEPPARQLTAAERALVVAQLAAADAALDRGDPTAAIQSANEVLRLEPRNARARSALGAALTATAGATSPPDLLTWQRAEGALLLARRLAPDDPVVLARYTRFLVADGHLSAAADVAEEGLAAHPEDVPLLLLAAETRYELGEERRAAEHLKALQAVAPDHAPSVYRLGMCQLRLATADDTDTRGGAMQALRQAVATFDRYRAMAPGDQDGWLAAGQARVRLAEELTDGPEQAAMLGDALSVWAEGEARFGGQPEFPYRVGWCFAATGKPAAATASYRRALAIQPDHAPALLALASLQAGSDPEAARALLSRALQADISSAERRQVLDWLTRHGGPIPADTRSAVR